MRMALVCNALIMVNGFYNGEGYNRGIGVNQALTCIVLQREGVITMHKELNSGPSSAQ